MEGILLLYNLCALLQVLRKLGNGSNLHSGCILLLSRQPKPWRQRRVAFLRDIGPALWLYWFAVHSIPEEGQPMEEEDGWQIPQAIRQQLRLHLDSLLHPEFCDLLDQDHAVRRQEGHRRHDQHRSNAEQARLHRG